MSEKREQPTEEQLQAMADDQLDKLDEKLAGLLIARVVAAVDIASTYGVAPSAHCKAWVIDQMVRALLTPNAYQGFRDEAVDSTWDEGIQPVVVEV